MPRNYVQKTQRGVGGTSDATQLQNALAEIYSKRMSTLQASKVFQVLRTTLHDHFIKKTEVKKPVCGGGRSQEIPAEIEKDMDLCLRMLEK